MLTDRPTCVGVGLSVYTKFCTPSVLTAVTQAIGSERVGLRLSPLNSYNSMKDSDPLALIGFLADKLNAFKLA